MSELPAGTTASQEELDDATEWVARLSAGDPSLLGELVADLAAGIRDRPLLITAADTLAARAAGHWQETLRRSGIAAHLAAEAPPGADLARIHLHGSDIAAADYAGAVIDEVGGDLVGEVIGQGSSAVARYQTLAVVGDALAAELQSAQLL